MSASEEVGRACVTYVTIYKVRLLYQEVLSLSKKIGITSSGVDSKYHVNPVQPPGPLRPLKEQLHGMAEKPVLPSAPGTPTGSLAQSEASSKHPYL